MLKFWLKLYSDNKIIKDYVCDACEQHACREVLEDGLRQCCYALDIPNPMILNKHIKDVTLYSLTKFSPDDFPESVDFDKAEVNLFDDSKSKKRVLF